MSDAEKLQELLAQLDATLGELEKVEDSEEAVDPSRDDGRAGA